MIQSNCLTQFFTSFGQTRVCMSKARYQIATENISYPICTDCIKFYTGPGSIQLIDEKLKVFG